jgi:hypothetical protein
VLKTRKLSHRENLAFARVASSQPIVLATGRSRRIVLKNSNFRRPGLSAKLTGRIVLRVLDLDGREVHSVVKGDTQR